MKIAGSGSIHQRHGSADPDPDPHQCVMDPQHCPQQHDPVTNPVVVEDTSAPVHLHTTYSCTKAYCIVVYRVSQE